MKIELKTRRKVYELIRKSPGIHFRELERRLGMAVGNLQYHLQYLEEKDLIKSEQDGKYTRYFPREHPLGKIDREILSSLRRRASRHILIYLLRNPNASNIDISKNVHLSPSTVSWHLNKLVEKEIVDRRREGRRTFFRVKDPERVARLLIMFKESFLDKLVEGFVETWEYVELD